MNWIADTDLKTLWSDKSPAIVTNMKYRLYDIVIKRVGHGDLKAQIG